MDALAELEAIAPPRALPDPDLTENARTVLERRYLKKDPATGKVCETPRELLWRVAAHIAKGELMFAGGSAEKALLVAREFYELMALRKFMPNSPTLMNAGREMGMLSACFVLPVEDSIEGIFDSIKATAMIQKAGGGTGFSFSRLRPQGDLVRSSGGTTEGPLSFIQVFSKATDAIQQGAFRRGANMGILRVDHPDIVSFITFKDNLGMLTNYNISVTVTNRFVHELRTKPDTVHQVMNPRTKQWSPLDKRDAQGKKTGAFWTVGEIWSMVIEHAWRTGEPGVVFIDRVNEKNPIKNVGLIEATNPCGEQPLHPYDSCNLGSINLGVLVKGEGANARFDWDEYKTIIHSTTRFLDNVIEVNKYPIPQIDSMSKTTRRIGLGVMGFADALYKLGISYNSPEGCAWGERVMQVLNDESHLASELLADERGPFPAWEGSDWEKQGKKLRNSYTTTVAPTGTISIIANCSGGIEPMFSLAFIRQVMKDEKGKPTVMREVNYVFEQIAKSRNFYSDELVDDIVTHGSLQHREEIPEELRKVFVTAHDITPYWHMKMQSAFQRHCDSSISKTINFPNEATAEDVRTIFELAIDEDVKGVTVYRDGCRDMQPMALKHSQKGGEGAAKPAEAATAKPGSTESADTNMQTSTTTCSTAPAPTFASEVGLRTRKSELGDEELNPVKLPEIMSCLRIRQMTPFGNMHVKVSVDPISCREREVFAQLGKGGDVANSDLEAICRILSLWLRSNGSLTMAIKQLEGIGSSLSVPTKDGRIMSLADGLATALARYLKAKDEFGLHALLLGGATPDLAKTDFVQRPVFTAPVAIDPAPSKPKTTPRNVAQYKLKCPACENNLAFEEGCVKCYGCGFSQC
ncbi:MAG: adenosylcobalamin-dependent ribonucleoside-diphosphate reductase [Planctomycetes bacterium]|nr:adenosylcobalamin-dependent ribonucleoside-diphosphate reductase [Planctomycetota bacterium]